MTSTRKLIVLCIGLALIVIGTWVDYQKRSMVAPLLKLGDVSKLELKFRGKKVALSKASGHWRLDRFDGKAAIDPRVNENLVVHILDIIRVLSDETVSPLDASAAKEYGMEDPILAVTVGWEAPSPGSEVVIFGNHNLSGKQIFAYFPQRPLLAEVPVVAVALLTGKEALDLRDRRITTFEVDDVEDLEASGKCGSFKLTRDGDRWVLSGAALSTSHAETWLATLLGSHYDSIEEPASETKPDDLNPVCKITIGGRHNRKESIDIFKTRGTLWAKNSTLAALYHLPQGILSALIAPH